MIAPVTCNRFLVAVFGLVVVGCCGERASAVELFSDNFNTTGSSANWTINAAPTANAGQQSATFAYDYSTMGIPAAPGSADTTGLRLRSNIPGDPNNPVTTRPAGTISGLSLSPTGKNFGANYQLTFQACANFVGAPNATGLADNGASEGGTYNVLAAVGTSGTVPMVVGNTALVTNGAMDGVGFTTTGDGGVNNDFRVYPASGTIVPGTTVGQSEVYAAFDPLAPTVSGTANTNTYYTNLFPPVAAPVEQQQIAMDEYNLDAANPQLGFTQAGSFGFAWHKVVIKKSGATVTWEIDDTLIATVDASALTLGGANIALGMSDVNASTTRHPALVFTLFDNLVVTDLPPVGGVPGDFDDSGTVNAADLAQWRDDFGVNGDSDADGDGDSDGADFLVWQKNLGMSGASGAATGVPEPGTFLLASVCALAFWRRQRGA
jgi:hypothetical protein